MNFAIKYRPKYLSDVIGQDVTVKVIKQQILTNNISNCMILCGHTGTGKTTTARALARELNEDRGTPIEIDAASNNGVDNVRQIIEGAVERALDSKYKIYIIDECHELSKAAWNALLKTIEEPPKYTIFIFCTTDPQKIPPTIVNRCQVFRLNRISDDLIKQRLKYICDNELFTYSDDSLNYLAKISEGSLRQAITYLDKCKDYSTDISVETVKKVLGDYSLDVYFTLVDAMLDGNKKIISDIVKSLYDKSSDFKTFISGFLDFVLQLSKFNLFKTLDCTTIPNTYYKRARYSVDFENSVPILNNLIEYILKIKQSIKFDNDIKTTVEVMLLSYKVQ